MCALMTDANSTPQIGTDWTGLLADPDLARNLGKLLKVFREAAPECKEQALLAAMREIKKDSSAGAGSGGPGAAQREPTVPTNVSNAPPYDPNVFGPVTGDDRRRNPRLKCFVAVEIHVNDAVTPLWGNLSNTSLGGCQVETASPIRADAKVEIGLWVASGKIWVKGVALNGVVTRSGPGSGVRIRFAGLDPTGKENLRQFLKYVQETTRAASNENRYIQLLK
jgi:hypothetical protein